MSYADPALEVARLLQLQQELSKYNKFDSYFPDEGPLRRELYPRHMEFFAAGATRRERCFMAGNRCGKTLAGVYELIAHLTGRYPAYWQGYRFNKPIVAWCAGDTFRTTRDIIQRAILGPIFDQGSGLLPKDCIERVTGKSGTADAVEGIFVKHISGGISELTLKSFDSGRESWQGAAIDVILLDEEPDYEIYVEALLRTATTGGLLMSTFTPLRGFSEIAREFISNRDADQGKFLVQVDWDSVPHLSAEVKAELLASIPEYQREARSKGIPALGSGAIYQVAEADIVVAPFPIPPYWPRAYGLDVGWQRTAAIWGARNNETGVTYLYDEYYMAKEKPVVHASGIKDRGAWIPGVVDPASRASSQSDGQQMLELYRREGLKLQTAVNAVEAGIYKVWQMLSAGKLKVFRTCGSWLSEYRYYQRDEEGKVIKKNDHLMDATRYLIVSGLSVMTVQPEPEPQYVDNRHLYGESGWMM
jgi:phage terminase large subunit-like protein